MLFELDIEELCCNSISFTDGTISGNSWTSRLSWLNKILETWGQQDCFDKDYAQTPVTIPLGRPDKTTEHHQIFTLLFFRHLLKYPRNEKHRYKSLEEECC